MDCCGATIEALNSGIAETAEQFVRLQTPLVAYLFQTVQARDVALASVA